MEEPKISFKKFKSKNVRKREVASSSSSSPSLLDSPSLDHPVDDTPIFKKPRSTPTNVSSSSLTSASAFKASIQKTSSSITHTYSTSGTSDSILPRDMGATKAYEPQEPIRKSLIEEDLELNSASGNGGVVLNADDLENGEETYKGLNAYNDYKQPGRESRIKAGPIRPSGNVRVTCRFDYQPDICKDYKETGFCGFGDSCIFLHDRGDYKSGWQLDQDWDKEQKQKAKDAEMTTFLEEENVYDKVHDGEASEKDVKGTGRAYGKKNDEEDLPFACLLCRQEFTDPIVTRCNHYFCEACALRHHRISTKCFACGTATNGVFSVAKELAKRIKAKKLRIDE